MGSAGPPGSRDVVVLCSARRWPGPTSPRCASAFEGCSSAATTATMPGPTSPAASRPAPRAATIPPATSHVLRLPPRLRRASSARRLSASSASSRSSSSGISVSRSRARSTSSCSDAATWGVVSSSGFCPVCVATSRRARSTASTEPRIAESGSTSPTGHSGSLAISQPVPTRMERRESRVPVASPRIAAPWRRARQNAHRTRSSRARRLGIAPPVRSPARSASATPRPDGTPRPLRPRASCEQVRRPPPPTGKSWAKFGGPPTEKPPFTLVTCSLLVARAGF